MKNQSTKQSTPVAETKTELQIVLEKFAALELKFAALEEKFVALSIPVHETEAVEKKKKKDPNAPKKAQSAYILFCNEKRTILKEEKPDLAFVDVSRELGKMWGLCEDKERYNALALLEKERYATEMTAYIPTN